MTADAAVIGAGVRARISDVNAAIERQSAFVFAMDEVEPGSRPPDRRSARDFVLRTLGALADGVNYRLLLDLRPDDVSFAQLREQLGLGDSAAWERVNDLVQAGLVARALDRDVIGLTATGLELVGFVEAAASAAQPGFESAESAE